MKKISSLLATLLICFFSSVIYADTFKIDSSHSYVMWHINHFGFSNPSGKWMVNGTVILNEKKLQDSQVNVSINVAHVITGIPKLDEHLRGVDFFDVAKYPKATFKSNKVVLAGSKKAKVSGILLLHGVSKPVTLNVVLNKIGMSPITNKKTIGFTASTTLKRSEFGITKYIPGLSDEVKINIEVEAVLED